MKKNNLSFLLGVLCFVTVLFISSCSNEDSVTVSTHQAGSINYSEIAMKYNLTDVTDPAIIETTKNLKPITPAELDQIMTNLFKDSGSIMSLGYEFPEKQNLASLRADVVKISASNSDGRADVHLDVDAVDVVNSSVYYSKFMDVFLYYNHLSGSARKSGDKITFLANGEVVVKIIWEGIELKRIPTTIEGYFNVSTRYGELTKF